MRRLPLFAALLAVLAFVVPGLARAEADEGIFLRGAHSAYVDLYVYANATIAPADIRMSTRGTYVGFYLTPAPANRDNVGALVMPRVGATGATASDVMQLGDSWDVQAGKYRMFLLTDGDATVFVPIEGQGYRGYVPRGRAPLTVKRADFNVAAGSAGGNRRVGVGVSARSLVIAAGMASSSSLTAVEDIDVCVTSMSSCTSPLGSAPPLGAAGTRLPAARAWTYGTALVMHGATDGFFDLSRLGGGDAGSRVDGAVLVLTIGIQT
jgi:hypothetical protein